MRTLPLSRRRQPTHCVHWFIPRVHELVARSSAWQVRAAKDGAKVGGFTAPLNLNYTTRASISHEKAEQIRARKPARPLDNGWRGREFSKCADGMESISFILSVGCAWVLVCRGRRLDDPIES